MKNKIIIPKNYAGQVLEQMKKEHLECGYIELADGTICVHAKGVAKERVEQLKSTYGRCFENNYIV